MNFLFLSTVSYSKNDEVWKKAILDEFPSANFLFWPDDTCDLSSIDYAITWKPPLGILQKCVRLKAILSLAAGIDSMLVDPDLPEVPIIRLIDPNLTQGMTEFILHWVLHYHRDFDRCIQWQKQKHWGFLPQRKPNDRKVGIMGLGELGSEAAKTLKRLNFDIAGWSRSRKNFPNIKSFAGDQELVTFLKRTEILVCVLPLTKKTEGIIRKETLSVLPKGAVLINAGRGAHMVSEDVLNAIDSGHLRAAVLDVFPLEPLPYNSRFWDHPKVIVTPHTASQTEPKSAAKFMAKNVRLIEKGASPLNILDKKRGY